MCSCWQRRCSRVFWSDHSEHENLVQSRLPLLSIWVQTRDYYCTYSELVFGIASERFALQFGVPFDAFAESVLDWIFFLWPLDDTSVTYFSTSSPSLWDPCDEDFLCWTPSSLLRQVPGRSPWLPYSSDKPDWFLEFHIHQCSETEQWLNPPRFQPRVEHN